MVWYVTLVVTGKNITFELILTMKSRIRNTEAVIKTIEREYSKVEKVCKFRPWYKKI